MKFFKPILAVIMCILLILVIKLGKSANDSSRIIHTLQNDYSILQSEYHKLKITPTIIPIVAPYRFPDIPSPNPYFPSINLSTTNLFTLDCFDNPKSEFDLYPQIEKYLNSREVVTNLCFNQELNRSLVNSYIETNTDGNDYTQETINFLKIFDHSNQTIRTIYNQDPKWCSNPKWTKSNFIYMGCSYGGDGGPLFKHYYSINLSNLKLNLIKTCEESDANNPICNSYCKTTPDCGPGEFCLSSHNLCVKSCSNQLECRNDFDLFSCFKFDSGQSGCL